METRQQVTVLKNILQALGLIIRYLVCTHNMSRMLSQAKNAEYMAMLESASKKIKAGEMIVGG